MTNINEQSQPENILDMRSITITLPGDATLRTEEDVDGIARETGEPKLALATGPDGSVEAQLGDFQLNIDRNGISVTHQLVHDPALAEPGIRDCCRFVAAILDGTQDAATIAVVRMEAIAAVAPEVGRALESGVTEPATTHNGMGLGVWHRLTLRQDPDPTGPCSLDYRYSAVTSVIAVQGSSQQTLEDAALAVKNEMMRLANLDAVPMFGEGDTDEALALMADPDFFDSVMSIFPESDDYTKECALDSVAKAVVAGYLTVPDGALRPTLAELRRLSQGYADRVAGHPDRPDAMESRNLRSMVLLRQIKRCNWPSPGGEGSAE